ERRVGTLTARSRDIAPLSPGMAGIRRYRRSASANSAPSRRKIHSRRHRRGAAADLRSAFRPRQRVDFRMFPARALTAIGADPSSRQAILGQIDGSGNEPRVSVFSLHLVWKGQGFAYSLVPPGVSFSGGSSAPPLSTPFLLLVLVAAA